MDIHKPTRTMDIHNIIMDIHKPILDIHNSIMDIHNWIMDIHKWIAELDFFAILGKIPAFFWLKKGYMFNF